MTMPAAAASWPGAHGHHLLVLPTTEPLWVGTEPISSPCTQPLPYHVCVEWHPVPAPPLLPLCLQRSLPYWKSEIVHGSGFLVQ